MTASDDVDGYRAARDELRRAGATVVDSDPVDAARRLAELDGLSALRAIMAGDIPPPPFGVLLGFEPVEVEEGRVVFAVEPDDRHYNPIGSVHGGLAATLIDSATGCAVHSTLPAGVAYTTTDLQVRYVRAITRDTGRILCEGTVVHRGRTIATAQARVTAGDRLLAHGTAGVLILPPAARTASTAPPASASG